MTYSIVARDPATGELGVGIQTCWFAVGTLAPWARAGVGAVATQAMVDPAYGPRCLDLLAHGLDAPRALERARLADDGASLRQVAVVDATGAVAAFTGERCIDHAGHCTGEGYSVQANMMATDRVWPAMADAFESSGGRLVDRMLRALRAGEDAGGDARGQMSAALIVVDPELSAGAWQGSRVDLRVDCDDAPLDELARLLERADAFAHCDRAESALERGDASGALAEVDLGLALLPGDGNLRMLRAGALLGVGRVDDATAEVRGLVRQRRSWSVVIRSMVDKGLVPVPATVDVERMLAGDG